MIKNLQKKRQEGFTIIEVLIVLAIAGLIILIVFLAVPALQRNSRNTQRKNDVAGVGGALTEYINNNNGAIPATCSGDATTGSGCGTTFANNFKTSLYDKTSTTNFKFTKQASAVVPSPVTSADILEVYNYAKCINNAPTAQDATNRSIIALYAVESGGSATPQCREL